VPCRGQLLQSFPRDTARILKAIMLGEAWFDWDDGNVDHIAEHGIRPDDGEDALRDPHRRRLPAERLVGEERWAAIGRTSSGRILFVVFTLRGRAIRIVTAYEATETEKRRHRRQRRR